MWIVWSAHRLRLIKKAGRPSLLKEDFFVCGRSSGQWEVLGHCWRDHQLQQARTLSFHKYITVCHNSDDSLHSAVVRVSKQQMALAYVNTCKLQEMCLHWYSTHYFLADSNWHELNLTSRDMVGNLAKENGHIHINMILSSHLIILKHLFPFQERGKFYIWKILYCLPVIR